MLKYFIIYIQLDIKSLHDERRILTPRFVVLEWNDLILKYNHAPEYL